MTYLRTPFIILQCITDNIGLSIVQVLLGIADEAVSGIHRLKDNFFARVNSQGRRLIGVKMSMLRIIAVIIYVVSI